MAKKKRCKDEKPTIQQYVYLPRRLDKKLWKISYTSRMNVKQKGKKSQLIPRQNTYAASAEDIFKLTIINVDIFSLYRLFATSISLHSKNNKQSNKS